MPMLTSYIGQHIELTISGRPQLDTGFLVDAGDDIVVIFRQERYYYIPTKHIHHFRVIPFPEKEHEGTLYENPLEWAAGESISFRKTLFNARGVFMEVYMTGVHTLSGYLTSVMNDYLVFYSTVFHTVYVPLDHVKLIMPYPANKPPFSLENERLGVKPTGLTLARTFEQQLKKMEGSLAVLDHGEAPDKFGIVQSVDRGLLYLVLADGESVIWNIQHIKSVHLP
ncbi:DUF2642 domain-containing protein [Paenibacillus phoenicis]|uniref:DUF2642 domain-containing protein n=1 Tax=Paenibacillus phoenicis TaxID=554117 RepID=A0ABU5PSD1_9BACL|nr:MULTISPECIES: DUF2642 domain-containing protein [Paenibacillus]MCT2195320.1 DUF2642 domain-containing protein [Paenibacillus sp. p3-SID1389]MEA3572572.1 DUF2642 domain-containing protein [Paenibacillus phoenicis]